MKHVNSNQRGTALILVLIVFSVGSLTIVPFLDYTRSSLHDVGASSGSLRDRYAAEAGAQHGFWQLTDMEGFAESIETSASYNLTFDATTEVPVTITRLPTSVTLDPIPPPYFQVPQDTGLDVSKTVNADLTPTVPGGDIPGVVTVDACVPNTFTYTIEIGNSTGATVHVIRLQDALPSEFTYVPGSWSMTTSGGPAPTLVSGSEPTVQIVYGRELITWEFVTPRPRINNGNTATLTFSASGTPSIGTHYNHILAELNREDTGNQFSSNYDDLVPGAVQAITSVFIVESSSGPHSVTAKIESSACGTQILSWSSS